MSNLDEETISAIKQDVKSELQDDLVDDNALRQFVRERCPEIPGIGKCLIAQMLKALLAEDVQIGDAVNSDGGYVRFVAWRGTVDQRVNRACREIERCRPSEADVAFWLCLSSNVDDYES